MTSSTGGPQIPRLDVDVDSAPNPGLIRPTIEAALAGRALPAGPETALAQAVANAVTALTTTAGGPSRC
ncbi:hypothetical protein ONA91_32680 [Micromonospora sp. DR5-3]|uniref:hypothetical protein n=1 Tax=unclassified Micromonospora TaxID=2617518 RepID=UPI0011D96EA8|nr:MULTISPECIES: hypothetical protein [unclassified Micromonospora]MCW3819208.1 hypothetical protein [Micromonospora sp. DR5-3]TYC20738.1 hypothetical protein FXF52_29705 [Micromonospora sp. MP36]